MNEMPERIWVTLCGWNWNTDREDMPDATDYANVERVVKPLEARVEELQRENENRQELLDLIIPKLRPKVLENGNVRLTASFGTWVFGSPRLAAYLGNDQMAKTDCGATEGLTGCENGYRDDPQWTQGVHGKEETNGKQAE